MNMDHIWHAADWRDAMIKTWLPNAEAALRAAAGSADSDDLIMITCRVESSASAATLQLTKVNITGLSC